MKKLVSAILVAVMLFAVLAVTSAAADYAAVVENLNRVPECDSTTKYLEGYNLAIFKKGSNFVIWTEIELSAEKQAALVAAIEASGAPGLSDLRGPDFAYGFTTFKLIGQDVTITPEGTILFEKKPTWSWFYRGNFAFIRTDPPR